MLSVLVLMMLLVVMYHICDGISAAFGGCIDGIVCRSTGNGGAFGGCIGVVVGGGIGDDP